MAEFSTTRSNFREIRMKLALKLFIAAAGLALFGWFVQRVGLNTISHAFLTLGWSAPLILLPFTLVYLLDTLGWRFAFGRAFPSTISFGTLFRIRWAGESLNNVVPSAYLGGEAAKVYLLHKRGVASARRGFERNCGEDRAGFGRGHLHRLRRDRRCFHSAGRFSSSRRNVRHHWSGNRSYRNAFLASAPGNVRDTSGADWTIAVAHPCAHDARRKSAST